MYNKIKNPLTNKWINTNSRLGKKIIRNYINSLYGGCSICGDDCVDDCAYDCCMPSSANWRSEKKFRALMSRELNKYKNKISKMSLHELYNVNYKETEIKWSKEFADELIDGQFQLIKEAISQKRGNLSPQSHVILYPIAKSMERDEEESQLIKKDK